MLINQSAQYALRAMIALTEAGAEHVMSATVLARRARVPRAYLSKIMRQLVDAHLASGRSGKCGGYWVTENTHYVRVADVLRAVGELDTKNSCVLGQARCDAAHPCLMHEAWSSMQGAYLEWANATTLADIVGRSKNA